MSHLQSISIIISTKLSYKKAIFASFSILCSFKTILKYLSTFLYIYIRLLLQHFFICCLFLNSNTLQLYILYSTKVAAVTSKKKMTVAVVQPGQVLTFVTMNIIPGTYDVMLLYYL